MPLADTKYTKWGIVWRSENKLDGMTRRFILRDGAPLVFSTRLGARRYIQQHYSYIADRPDLRAEPHGWKTPIAVRVVIRLTELYGGE